METVYVIGSGSSGIACTLGLLARKNVKVIMLDVGKTLESEFLENRIKNSSPIIYPNDVLPWEHKSKHKKFNKHLFGSVYPYDIGIAAHEFDLINTLLRVSFAKGGLSNVWGASIMPYRVSELAHWPISAEEIKLSYRNILKYMPLSTCAQDDFTDWPIMHDDPKTFQLSQQAHHLLNRYNKSRTKLHSTGIIAGGARLAVYQVSHRPQSGCTYCGECMYGCVNDSIYSTRHTISDLKNNPAFEYRSGIRIKKIAENNDRVTIEGYDESSKSAVMFSGNSIFIAAGVLMSAQIMMNSFPWLQQVELQMKDSQHFLLPCIMLQRFKHLRYKPSHTMSQLFYEIVDKQHFTESAHLQLHTYISLYENEFEKKLKFLKKFRPLLNPFYERLIVFQGFLPSSMSGHVSIRLHPHQQKLLVSGHENSETEFYIKQILKKFRKHIHHLGFLPMLPFYKISQVGISNHHGSTFPMTKKPQHFAESDIYGTPFGLHQVHIVDASVLPSIQAQSVTLTSMANAYRIGNACEIPNI